MRIKKLCCTWSKNFFRPMLMEKYGMEIHDPEMDINQPVVFFGCYGVGIKEYIMKHQGLAIIVWSGSDSTRLHEFTPFVRYCNQNQHRVFNIAHSHWIQKDLEHHKMEYIDRVVLPKDLSEYKFCPTWGDKVYHYGSKDRIWYYGSHLMQRLRNEWEKPRDRPKVEIVLSGSTYGQKELIKIYQKSFIGVRLTEHDNMALSAIELGLMGRRTIYNGNIPCAIHYGQNYTKYDPETRRRWVYQDQSLLNVVKNLVLEQWKRHSLGPDRELAEEMREFVFDDEKWLDTKFYE